MMPNTDQFRVAFVDQDDFYGSIIKERLGHDGSVNVQHYSSGLALIDQLHEEPHMVVVDQTLPDVSIRGLFDLIKLYNQKASLVVLSRNSQHNIESDEQIHLANKQISKDENAVRNLTELIRIHLLSFQDFIWV